MANVSLVRYTPLGGNNLGHAPLFRRAMAPRGRMTSRYRNLGRASTHFLDSIGVPIVRGRDFTAQDTATSRQVVDRESGFRKAFLPQPGSDRQTFRDGSPQYSGAFEIVGVFADFKMTDPREEVKPLFFRPLSQQFTGYKEPESDAGEKSSMFVDFIILDFAQAPAGCRGEWRAKRSQRSIPT